jgi:DNA-binding NtrC family response regulator
VNEQTILIVDDEIMLCDSMADYYKIDGYKVLKAYGGKEALEVLDCNQVDLIISDVRMPNGDGEFLLTEVRKKDAKNPPMVLVSGFSELTREKAKELGAIDLLEKPIDFDSLDRIVEEKLRVIVT